VPATLLPGKEECSDIVEDHNADRIGDAKAVLSAEGQRTAYHFGGCVCLKYLKSGGANSKRTCC
jgi:hypothetical protein